LVIDCLCSNYRKLSTNVTFFSHLYIKALQVTVFPSIFPV
jgi:hypothetical protein